MPAPNVRFLSTIRSPAAIHGPTYWFLFQENRLLMHEAGETLHLLHTSNGAPPVGIVPVRTQYLGRLQDGEQGIHCVSGEIADDATLPAGITNHGLRALFDVIDDATLMLAGRAIQIVEWDRNHQFCGRCAAPTQASETERVRTCPVCGLSSYPRLSPAIIIAVTRMTDEGPRILLARNHRFPAGRYSVIAGFVEPGESLEECCRREVYEEVGIDIAAIHYFGSQPWPFPNSLMVGFTAEYAGGELRLEAAEIAEAHWFAPDALPGIPPKISIARRLIDWFVATHAEPTGA